MLMTYNFYFWFVLFYTAFPLPKLLIEIVIHSADGCTLAMVWVDYVHVRG